MLSENALTWLYRLPGESLLGDPDSSSSNTALRDKDGAVRLSLQCNGRVSVALG